MSAWTREAKRTGGRAALLAFAAATLAACAGGPRGSLDSPGLKGAPTPRYTGYKVGQPYQIRGVWYFPKEQPGYEEIGVASWYGAQFHNQYTADGEVFDMNLPSAAHKTLPLPSLVEVTNLANGRSLLVRVNDRGPFVEGRVIDLSREAAAQLGFVTAGITRVRVRYVGRAPDPPGWRTPRPPSSEPPLIQAQAPRPAARPPLSQLAQAAAGAPPAAARLAQAPTKAAAAAGAPGAQAAASVLPDVDGLLAGTAPPPAPPAAASYQLQAGAFASEAAAQDFAARLPSAGLPEVLPVTEAGQTAWRVVVHGLATPAEASAARSAAVALGAPDPRILAGS